MTHPETIHWVPVTERVPDDDTTVLVYVPDHDEPVWLGWLADGEWRLIDATPLEDGEVQAWAEMPGGPL